MNIDKSQMNPVLKSVPGESKILNMTYKIELCVLDFLENTAIESVMLYLSHSLFYLSWKNIKYSSRGIKVNSSVALGCFMFL